MLPFLDPFVSIDISSKPGLCSLDEKIKSSDGCDAYEEVKAYLSAACTRDARELHADGDGFVLSLREGQEVADEFRGAAMWWASVLPAKQGQGSGNQYCLRLTFDQHHCRLVVDEYMLHIHRSGRDVMFRNRCRQLYTNKKSID
jgi:chaperone BCS1